jgi:hypothetical protein
MIAMLRRSGRHVCRTSCWRPATPVSARPRWPGCGQDDGRKIIELVPPFKIEALVAAIPQLEDGDVVFTTRSTSSLTVGTRSSISAQDPRGALGADAGRSGDPAGHHRGGATTDRDKLLRP